MRYREAPIDQPLPASVRRSSISHAVLGAAFVVISTLSLADAQVSSAQAEAVDPSPKRLVVGTKEAAPFAFKGTDGTWQGLSIELWRRAAEELGLAFELRELSLDEILAGVEDGSLDAAVAALTITSEREGKMDFSHPFYVSGLGIAVAEANGTAGWLAATKSLVSEQFLRAVGALLALLFAVGFVLWLFERRRNAEQFGGNAAEGLGAAFWWSAVTMTTVGYGDKAPTTFGGRFVGFVWMFASVIIISGFTAAIASSLTIDRLSARIHGPEDLPAVRVGSVAETTSAAYLGHQRIDFQAYVTVEEGMAAVAEGEIQALVYDAPILRYLARKNHGRRVSVLGQTFERQDYGIALPTGSPLREDLNRVLLHHVRSPWWEEVVYEVLGI